MIKEKSKIHQKKHNDERKYVTFSLYPEEKEVIDAALVEAKKLLKSKSNSKAIFSICYDWLMRP